MFYTPYKISGQNRFEIEEILELVHLLSSQIKPPPPPRISALPPPFCGQVVFVVLDL